MNNNRSAIVPYNPSLPEQPVSWLGRLMQRFKVKRPKIKVSEEPKLVRRTVDTNNIRTRLKTQGWNLREIPITKNHIDKQTRYIARWKLIAVRGEKSLEVGGTTLDEAMKTLGQTLGVIARDK